ncbi:hypothetical protein L1887_27560 [Cichorium endivia]|nr:hypothetical protein L1887_27560 [Cichorium endivia]
MILMDEELGDADVMPKEFDVFVGKRYAFKIEVKTFNLKNHSRVYSITKLTNDEKIISSLLEKVDAQQPTQTESLNTNISDSGSLAESKNKDVVSCTGDNATPIDFEKSETTSIIQEIQNKIISRDLKRKLDNEINLDDSTKSSSTKMKKVSTFEQSEVSLLIPKKEK